MRPSGGNAGFVALVGVACAVIGLGLVAEQLDWFESMRARIQTRRVPTEALRTGAGQIARLMQHRGRTGIEIEAFDAGLSPEAMPSTRAIPYEVLGAGVPILSVAIDPEDLYDRYRGIASHPEKRGMKWERPAYVSYFDDGELSFASGVGLRVHGGRSRQFRNPSFRMHFREPFGEEQFAPGVLFPDRDPIRSLVIHNDIRRNARDGTEQWWRLINPLAYDISRRIGCETPRTKTVRFFINGEDLGPYVLTEHLSPEWMETRLGHGEFVLVNTKGDRIGKGARHEMMRGSEDSYDDFVAWATAGGALDPEEAARRVDLDNLSRWFISVAYLALTDENQGLQVRETKTPTSPWRWVNWDMDHAFVDRYHRAAQPWEFDGFASALGNDENPRAVILRRLVRDSPEFRARLLALFEEVLEERLTPDFLDSRIAEYETLAKLHGVERDAHFVEVREFVAHRHEVLREQMRTYLGSNEAVEAVAAIGR